MLLANGSLLVPRKLYALVTFNACDPVLYVTFTVTRLAVCDKLSLKVKLKKKPVHRSHEETLTLGQFVGACMGGVPPQYIVS